MRTNTRSQSTFSDEKTLRKSNRKIKSSSESSESMSEEDGSKKKSKNPKTIKYAHMSDEEESDSSDSHPSLFENEEPFESIDEIDENADECFICEDGGDLVLCDQCYRAFHKKCMDQKKIPEGVWLCQFCRQLESKECCVCQKEVKNEPFHIRCSSCLRLMHYECCQTPIQLILESPINSEYAFLAEDYKRILLQLKKVTNELDPEIREKENLELQHDIKTSLSFSIVKCLFHLCLHCIEVKEIDLFLENATIETTTGPQQFYMIKLKRTSFQKVCFICETWAMESSQKLKNFVDRGHSLEEMENLTLYRNVERIVSCKRPQSYIKLSFAEIYSQKYDKKLFLPPNHKDSLYFLVKWQLKSYNELTWESEYILYDCAEILKDFFKRKVLENKLNNINKPFCEKDIIYERPNLKSSFMLKNMTSVEQPIYITSNLYKFQLQGISWMFKKYNSKKNCILADEMGLGKTIQSLSLLNAIYHEKNNDGPFLVVAPLTTLQNWLNESKTWLKHLNVIIFSGDIESRDMLEKYELYYQVNSQHKKGKNFPKFNLMITSYDMAMYEFGLLKEFNWEVLIFDEAHRLKNDEAKLYSQLAKLRVKFKLLLTGTPLQNNLRELINLIKFLDSKKLDDLNSNPLIKKVLSQSKSQGLLEETNGNKKAGITTGDPFVNLSIDEREKVVHLLKETLQPIMLRRTKADVEIQLPEIEEHVVKLPLSSKQLYLYKDVLLNNFDHLKKKKNGFSFSLNNTLMNLRLICSHPLCFLFRSQCSNLGEDQELQDTKDKEEKIVGMSNKIKFLDKYLPKILSDGESKLLIFSQFVMMLDVVRDYLDLRDIKHFRLDGQTNPQIRQKNIDSFNSEKSEVRIMLMSTKAGGLGVNLTAANIILFLDSDFNPFNDLQAMARAHRIGQKRKVSIIRLVSNSSVEEKIYLNCRRKMFFSNVITSQIRNANSKENDLKEILKFGAEQLLSLNEESLEKSDEILTKIVDNLIQGGDQAGDTLIEKVQNLPDTSFLKELGLNQASMINETQQIAEAEDDDIFWGRLLGEEEKNRKLKETEGLGKGKRIRKPPMHIIDHTKNITAKILSTMMDEEEGSNGSEKKKKEVEKTPPESEPQNPPPPPVVQKNPTSKKKDTEKDKDKDKDNEDGKGFKNEHINYFNEIDAALSLARKFELQKVILMFGLEFNSVEDFFVCVEKNTELFKILKNDKSAKLLVWEYFIFICFLMRNYDRFPPDVVAKWLLGFDPYDFYIKTVGITLLRTKFMKKFQSKNEDFWIDSDFYNSKKVTELKDERDNTIQYWYHVWTNYDDFCLVRGILECGFGQWKKIVMTEAYWEKQINPPTNKKTTLGVLFSKIEKEKDKVIELDQISEVEQYVLLWIEQQANNLLNLAFENS